MPVEPREPTIFETVPTEDVGEVACVLRVTEDRILASTVITAGMTLAAVGSQLRVDLADAQRRGFGSYILTQPAPKQNGYHTYYFGKPKTDAQKAVPFRSTPDSMDIPWPNVLRNLYGGTVQRELTTETVDVSGTPTTNIRTLTEFQDRYELIPGMSYPTEVLIEEFQSATPWEQFDAIRPVPTTVRYFYKGQQMSLDCLHDDVVIPDLTSSFTRDEEFGTPNARTLPDGQFFPATNPTSWIPYVYEDGQQFRNGVYYRRRVTIQQVPPLPRALRF